MRKLLKVNWKTTLAGAALLGLELTKLVKPQWEPLLTSIQTTVVGGGLIAAADSKKALPPGAGKP